RGAPDGADGLNDGDRRRDRQNPTGSVDGCEPGVLRLGAGHHSQKAETYCYGASRHATPPRIFE
ncbi:MAG: hypothetical protein ACK463_35295, partial [Bradyrhizobium sp.]